MVNTRGSQREGSIRPSAEPERGAEGDGTPSTLAGRDNGQESSEAAAIAERVRIEEQKLHLLELRARTIRAEEELRLLEAAQGQGDATVASTTQGEPGKGSLPKDREPPVFEGKTRANYDDWVRAVERKFRRYAGFYSREDLKTDYAGEYMGKLQQDHWDRHVRQLAAGEPTWAMMRQVMLDSMGSESERKQRAHDQLRTVIQGSRTPTELLEEMKTCWQEVGEDREDQMIIAFISALDHNLKWRVRMNLVAPTTLKEAEDRANWALRLAKEQAEERKETRQQQGRKRQGTSGAPSPPGTRESIRRSTPAAGGPSKAQERPRSPPTCYGCRQVGHKKNECPNKHLWEQGSEKERTSTNGPRA